jgi:hypothetical protein
VALESYKRVVDTWRTADPNLQPYVAEARAGLDRLTSERLGISAWTHALDDVFLSLAGSG